MRIQFVIRLILVFLIAPILGSLLANIPGSIIFNLATSEDSGALGLYGFLMIGSVLYGYPSMLLGIYFVGVYASRNYKLPIYLITGVLLGLLAVFPMFIFLAEKEQLLNAIAIISALNGMSISAVSYFLMREK